jgi:hypothetical protein
MDLESSNYPEVQSYHETERESLGSVILASLLFLVLVGLIIGAAVYFQ